jgi:hypothetical protein
MKARVALALALLAIAACNRANKYAGTWEGKYFLPPETVSALQEIAPPGGMEQLNAELASKVLVLDLRKDMKYSLTINGVETVTGTWSLADDQSAILLVGRVLTEAGLANAKAMGATEQEIVNNQSGFTRFEFNADRSTLTNLESYSGLSWGMSFTKR